jgi:hypothetical protein
MTEKLDSNKTLADAQPGGRVRLGAALVTDAMVYAAEDAYANSKSDNLHESFREAIAAALSAQPSPGGQDALAVIEELAELNRACAALDPDYKGPSDAAVQAAIAALAARQLVGEVIEYQTNHVNGGWTKCDKPHYDDGKAYEAAYPRQRESLYRTLVVGDAASQPVGEAIAEVVLVNGVRKLRVYPDEGLPSLLQFPVGTKFYTAPPAQAVDLGPVRDVFRRWHANELNSTDAMLALVEALAVIDSQAAGNGN